MVRDSRESWWVKVLEKDIWLDCSGRIFLGVCDSGGVGG